MDTKKSGIFGSSKTDDFRGFEAELREKTGENEQDELVDAVELKRSEKIGQNQFYDIVTGRQPDWQAIIYELIHTEQLDPWDINITILTKRYFEKILELEELDFYISSKVLLAASLLVRIKSEFLLSRHIKSIDEILFGKKEENKYVAERIEIDEEDLPLLIPKTPLPRQRKVTLDELMAALNKAINTETRRIKREVAVKRAKKLSEVDFPSFRKVDLKDRIKQFYARVLTSLKRKSTGPDKHMNKVGYSELIGKTREEKLASFLPVLHLSNTRKLWLEQEGHLEEIWIYLYEYFKRHPEHFIEDLEKDLEEMKDEPGGELITEEREEEIKEIARQVAGLFKDAQKEEENIEKEEKIEEITGFKDELE
ncbi:MAG: segregation/condensation protein A [Candidatus Nanoarchaeia archaeon]|nr:segregation/condensation protein A [Candidatus Nanoarchaeia archaeon]MDD5741650.1 segregation/condensation protein A [Candidatus Nanoarchaeia archaeon]